MTVAIEAALAAHVAGLVRLFEADGCPCYCHFWHFDGDDNEWELACAQDREKNRATLERSFREGSPQSHGLVALDTDAGVVGWLKLSWVRDVAKMFTRRLYRTLPYFQGPRDGVVVVGCLLVHPAHRRQGVARALVKGALSEARRRGARAVEALPRRTSEPVGDHALWLGPATVYLEHGFRQVDGPEGYPVLRFDLHELGELRDLSGLHDLSDLRDPPGLSDLRGPRKTPEFTANERAKGCDAPGAPQEELPPCTE